jgi:hypothetical protein
MITISTQKIARNMVSLHARKSFRCRSGGYLPWIIIVITLAIMMNMMKFMKTSLVATTLKK